MGDGTLLILQKTVRIYQDESWRDSSLMPNLYLLRENFDCPARLRQLSRKTGPVDEPRLIEISAVVG